MAYKNILIDNDETLMDFKKAQEFAFYSMYEKSGLQSQQPVSADLLDSYESCNHLWWKKLELGQCDKSQLQEGRFRDFLAANKLFADPLKINGLYMQELGQGRFLLEGAIEILRYLHSRYRVFITTNGVAETQRSRINGSELINYVDGIFVSEETGFAKPDKRYFEYIMEFLDCKNPKEYIVIGDSLSSDISGAKNAGMDSIWFNPNHCKNPENIAFSHEIHKLTGIKEIL